MLSTLAGLLARLADAFANLKSAPVPVVGFRQSSYCPAAALAHLQNSFKHVLISEIRPNLHFGTVFEKLHEFLGLFQAENLVLWRFRAF